jgi:hypothetical protein
MNLPKLCREYQLEPGDQIGTTDFGPVSLALRHRQAGPGEAFIHARVATHIACVVGCHQGGGLDLVEATPPAVRPSRETDVHGKVCFVWRPYRLNVDKAIQYLHSEEGTPYDLPAFPALWGFGKQHPKMKYCSELGGGALAAGGYPLYPLSWSIMVRPWDMQLHAHAAKEIIYASEKAWW